MRLASFSKVSIRSLRAPLFLCGVLCIAASWSGVEAEADLIGYWKLDGDTIDSSGNNAPGVLSGSTSYVAGSYGQGVDFSGDYTSQLATGVVLDGSAKTMVLVAKTDDFAPQQLWAGNAAPGSGNYRFYYGSNNTLPFLGAGGTYTQNPAWSWQSTDTSAFHHYALVDRGLLPSGNKQLVGYQNGQEVARMDYPSGQSTATAPGKQFLIGRSGGGGPVPSRAIVDDVALFDTALPQTAVDYIADHGVQGFLDLEASPSITAGLVGYWAFDGDAIDGTGRGHDGVEQGGVGYTVGKFGQALSLDGIDGWVEVPDHPDLRPGEESFTIAGWINLTEKSGSGDSDQAFMNKGDHSNVFGLRIPDADGQTLRGGMQNQMPSPTQTTYLTVGNVDLEDANDPDWHHIAMVVDRDANQQKFYLDGVQLGATHDISSFTRSIDNLDSLEIGRAIMLANGTYAKGLMDDLAYWGRALESNELLAIALSNAGVGTSLNALIPEPSSGLLGVFGLLSLLAVGGRRRRH